MLALRRAAPLRASALASLRALSTAPSRVSQKADLEMLNASLADTDPDLWDIMEHEKRRQRTSRERSQPNERERERRFFIPRAL